MLSEDDSQHYYFFINTQAANLLTCYHLSFKRNLPIGRTDQLWNKEEMDTFKTTAILHFEYFKIDNRKNASYNAKVQHSKLARSWKSSLIKVY